jgi:AraC-like DNA-binding protein
MQFNFSDILFTLVLFLLLFISVFLFTSDKGKRISNILIGSFFLALALNLADSFLLLKQVYFQYPEWAGWGSNLLLLCGPLIFFYTQSVIYKNFHLTKRKLLHFVPFLILFFVAETGYLAAGRQTQIKILNSIIERKMPAAIYLVSCVVYIHFFAYLFAARQSVKKYELAASNQYSEVQKVTLGWLKTIISFFLALMLVSVVNSYLSYQSMGRAYFFLLSITIFLLLLFIIFVLFKALRNPAIFSVWEQKEVEEAVQAARYATSPIQDNEKKRVLDKLLQHMQSQRPYLAPELTLDDLAVQIAVKPKLLSQVINELLHRNFFEFINHYRIEEAKRLLTNPEDKKITVLEVLYEVGFNSKSSFNTLFKKHTGLTPSEFKKNSLT